MKTESQPVSAVLYFQIFRDGVLSHDTTPKGRRTIHKLYYDGSSSIEVFEGFSRESVQCFNSEHKHAVALQTIYDSVDFSYETRHVEQIAALSKPEQNQIIRQVYGAGAYLKCVNKHYSIGIAL